MAVRDFMIMDVVSVSLKVVTDSRWLVRDKMTASVTDRLLVIELGGGVDSIL